MVRRKWRYLSKKIPDLVKYPLSFPLSLFSVNFNFFWRAHQEFVCNLKGGKASEIGEMPLEAGIVGRPALTREAFYQAIGKSQNAFDNVGSDSFRKVERSGNVLDTSRVREPEFSKRLSKGKLACSLFA